MAGETAVKGGLGVRKEEPEGGGIPGGDWAARSLNNFVPRRIPRAEQSPGGGGTRLAPVGNCRQGAGLNVKRATADDESVRLFAGQNP